MKSVQLIRVWEIRVGSGERASDLELQSASTSATVTTEQVRVFAIKRSPGFLSMRCTDFKRNPLYGNIGLAM